MGSHLVVHYLLCATGASCTANPWRHGQLGGPDNLLDGDEVCIVGQSGHEAASFRPRETVSKRFCFVHDASCLRLREPCRVIPTGLAFGLRIRVRLVVARVVVEQVGW